MTDSIKIQELEELIKILRKEKDEAILKLEDVEKDCSSKEDFLQQMIDHTNEGMLILKGDRIKYINKKAIDLLEFDTDNLDKQSFIEFVDQPQRGQLIKQMSEVLSGNKDIIVSEIDILNSNENFLKTEFIVESINHPSLSHLLLVKFQTKQITEPAEVTLSTEKNTSKNTYKSLSDDAYISLLAPSHNSERLFLWSITDYNQELIDILEIEETDIHGKSLSDFVISDFDYTIDESSEGFDETFELYALNLKKYVLFRVKRIDNSRVICKVSDVSEINNVKKQLEKNIRQNELVTEILGIINSALTFEEKLEKINDQIAFYFNTKRILLIDHLQKNDSGVLKTQHAKGNLTKLNEKFEVPFIRVPSYMKMLNERNMVLGFSIKYLPDDLKSFFMGTQFSNVYVFPINIENKMHASIIFEAEEGESWNSTEINHLKIVTRLITTLFVRQFNEDKLLKSKIKAEKADRLKSSFLASMSHDIRIPMTAIIGFSDLLADPDLTLGEREEFIELINKSGQDLLALIDNIIDVSKIETGQFTINKEKVNLETVFSDIFAHHSRNEKLKEHDDIEIMLDFDDKYSEIPFETDLFRFKQVFDNLIENAIKFTDKGVIKFGVQNVWDNTIEFYVQDTGIGIPEETQSMIFESFTKVDRSFAKEYNGTGLGLTLSKSIVEIMGGEIRVVSKSGKGSTFYFTHKLPVKAENLVKEKSSEHDNSVPDWSGRTILIAEDVIQNFKYLEFMLSPTNAVLEWAKNGREAVTYFASGKTADIVLMDIRMPILNGLEASKEILKMTKVPIIAQTAYTFGDEKLLAEQAGCADYLTKPINANNLFPMVEKILSEGY